MKWHEKDIDVFEDQTFPLLFFFSKDEIKLTNAQQSVCIFSRCCNLIIAEDIPKN